MHIAERAIVIRLLTEVRLAEATVVDELLVCGGCYMSVIMMQWWRSRDYRARGGEGGGVGE